MTIGILLPASDDIDPVTMATRAEQLGYDAVWLPELWGRSGPVVATRIAERTDDIGIGTAILNVFSRSPAVLAMTAASIDEAADGRFVLGLGTSTASAVEGVHGTDFERPVRRAHETVEIVRALTAGRESVSYDGQVCGVQDVPPLDREVPVYGAALGTANRRMVGRCCDGWIPHNVPFPAIDETFETIATAAREAGRDPDEITVAPYVPTAVCEDVERAREAIRGHIAYYVGSGAGYRRAVSHRFPDAAGAIADAWAGGERAAARSAVTDGMVEELGVASTPARAREAFSALIDGARVDHAILVVPANAPDLVEGTMDAVVR